jgi:hypothetical protein
MIRITLDRFKIGFPLPVYEPGFCELGNPDAAHLFVASHRLEL